MEEKIKKPKLYTILLVVAICLLSIGIITVIVGVTLVLTGNNDYAILLPATICPGAVLIFFSFPCFMIGLSPQIAKVQIEKARYIQQLTKQSQTEFATTNAEIMNNAVKRTARAVKDGLTNTKFCKECGKEIDSDAKFCKECGTKQ